MTTLKINGNTIKVIHALVHKTYEELANELTYKASIKNEAITELLRELDLLKSKTVRNNHTGQIVPLYNENGSIKRSVSEVSKYQDAIKYAISNKLALSEVSIKKIHSLLFSDDHQARGKYKNVTNDLTLPSKEPNTKYVIATTPPGHTCREMSYLIKWTNRELKVKHLHPLIIISAFISEFLFIHPFQDGNGRTSRILTQMLLADAGYRFAECASLDDVINADRWIHSEILLKEAHHRNAEQMIKLDLWIRYYLLTVSLMTKQLSIN